MPPVRDNSSDLRGFGSIGASGYIKAHLSSQRLLYENDSRVSD